MKQQISNITVPKGRAVNSVRVSELAESINIVGLLNPITIDKGNVLIAGAHRLEACKHLGLDEIECFVLDADELRIELAEIDENLIRSDHDDIAMGELAIRRDEILEALGLRANQSNKGKSTGAKTAPLQTTGNIAKEAGVSKRTLQENKQLARSLTPEAKEAIRNTKWTKQDALRLARKDADEQKIIAQKIFDGNRLNGTTQQ